MIQRVIIGLFLNHLVSVSEKASCHVRVLWTRGAPLVHRTMNMIMMDLANNHLNADVFDIISIDIIHALCC